MSRKTKAVVENRDGQMMMVVVFYSLFFSMRKIKVGDKKTKVLQRTEIWLLVIEEKTEEWIIQSEILM